MPIPDQGGVSGTLKIDPKRVSITLLRLINQSEFSIPSAVSQQWRYLIGCSQSCTQGRVTGARPDCKLLSVGQDRNYHGCTPVWGERSRSCLPAVQSGTAGSNQQDFKLREEKGKVIEKQGVNSHLQMPQLVASLLLLASEDKNHTV